MDLLKKRYKRDPDIISRRIDNEAILVPVKKNIADFEGIFTLNEVGAFVWDLIDPERDIESIKEKVLDEFDISSKEAGRDIAEFVKSLEKTGNIKEV